AATDGDYFVGISSAPNDNYDPQIAESGLLGETTGRYTLNLCLTPGAPLLADLAGSSFRLGTDTAAWGDTVPVTFTVENRGGAGAGGVVGQVVRAAANLFGPQWLVLATLPVAGLGAGQAFAPGGFTVTLPDLASATAAGLPVSGSVYLGLRIDPAGLVPELNR